MSKEKDAQESIPEEIAKHEIIVRALLFPLLFSVSKKKLKDPAFSPPPGKNEVSVLRHDYTTSDICKQHGKQIDIKENTYGGLAVIQAGSIAQVNNLHSEKFKDESCVEVSLVASPLPNLPTHADITYSIEFPDDEPKIQIRMIARELIKQAVFLEDPDPEKEKWTGKPITLEILKKG